MKKQILDRGYITNALTDGDKKILGIINDHHINFNLHQNNKYYWSEVYCEPGNMFTIIRRGVLLINPSAEELHNYFEQSKINLH